MALNHVLGYRCSVCGAEQAYAPRDVVYACPRCSGNFDLVFDYEAIRRAAPGRATPEPSLWRYLPLLPVSDPGLTGTPLRAAGWTPLYRAERLEERLGQNRVFIKDDGRNPTASFKDRASAVVVARALELGVSRVVTASTGNAGAALAGMAAAAGVPATILAPASAPPAKVAQLLVFGAQVVLVDGTYDDAFDLTVQAAETFGWYCRNTGYNPFTAEGKKSAAFEIAEQLAAFSVPIDGCWPVPDVLCVSVGDGNILSGIWRGFQDLLRLGWTERMPKLIGVQAEGSAACARAWESQAEKIVPVSARTLADSISVDLPRDGLRAVHAVRDTGGSFVVVSDDEILAAMATLGREAAVFAEPAGATAYAGLAKAVGQGLVPADASVLVMNTGNGLKDVASARRAVSEPMRIAPNLESLREALGARSA
ncbi:MAG: threonine synthase [Anaerolineales bacterium]|nr:threonine synthase [Anaerolineales bacterium]